MRARRLLFARGRLRTRLVPIFVALLSLASLGLAGFLAALRPDPSPNFQDRPTRGEAAAESRPVEGVLRAPPQGRDRGGRKSWM
jgi:hypothetical protein